MVNREYISEPAAVRYGFLSARAAGMIERHLETGQPQIVQQELLNSLHQIVAGIVSAQRFHESAPDAVAPSNDALEAYTCALNLLVEKREQFGVQTIGDLVNFIDGLRRSIERLMGDVTLASDEELSRTGQFFAALSERMLAELNRFRDPILGMR